MIVLYNAVAGACAEQKANAGGGGGTPGVSVATSASGNYDNAIEIVLVNGAHGATNSNNFSGGILGGAQSTFGTATSPTRTTQAITASATAYLNSWNANGQGNAPVLIGGYIRSNNFTTSNKQVWEVASGTILSQSFSTGVSVFVTETNNSRGNIRDNTFATGATTGIYNAQGHGTQSGSGFYGITIAHAGGRGASTLPQVGDSFTFRLSAEDDDGSTTYSAIHDVTITWA